MSLVGTFHHLGGRDPPEREWGPQDYLPKGGPLVRTPRWETPARSFQLSGMEGLRHSVPKPLVGWI